MYIYKCGTNFDNVSIVVPVFIIYAIHEYLISASTFDAILTKQTQNLNFGPQPFRYYIVHDLHDTNYIYDILIKCKL